jgi:hypothetical protein
MPAATATETGPVPVGDITKMWVAFDIASGTGCGTPVTTIYSHVLDTGSVGDGIGTATSTYTYGPETTLCVITRLVAGPSGGVNQYYTSANAETASVTFYLSLGQFVSGGGWIIDPNTSSHGNFGFTARYNNNNKTQGQMVYVYRGVYSGTCTSGSGVTATWSSVPVDFVIKSNSLSSLSFSGTTYPLSATLQGGDTIQTNRQSDGVNICSEGGASFTARAWDTNANSGIGSDSYSLTVLHKDGSVYKSIAQTLLSGGNVVIHIK